MKMIPNNQILQFVSLSLGGCNNTQYCCRSLVCLGSHHDIQRRRRLLVSFLRAGSSLGVIVSSGNRAYHSG
jgi:hypothetical protein